jgi:hypothetical protein
MEADDLLREEVAEKAGGLAQEGAAGLHAPKLLEDGEGDDFGVRELLEGSVEVAPRVEDSVGVVDLAKQDGDRFFQEFGFWSMLRLGHPVLLWSGLRVALLLSQPTTQHSSSPLSRFL